MNRRRMLALAAFAATSPANAQPTGRLKRIGVLHWTSVVSSYFDVFKAALRDLGQVEGQTVEFVIRTGGDRADLAAALAAELVALPVDVLVATSTGPALAAKRATRTIPIVVSAADLVASGLVSNLARPEANVTGVSLMSLEIMGKCVEIAGEIVPNLKVLGFLAQPSEPNVERFLKAMRAAGGRLGVQIAVYWARDSGEFNAAFSQAARDGAGAMVSQPIFQPLGREIADVAMRHRMPTVGPERLLADGGGLIAYGVDRDYTWRRLAAIVERILRGSHPADLPVEQSVATVLVVNARTARALGLTIPPAILARADEVIE